jgi:hypothetical protein
MEVKKETLASPPSIFFVYVVAASLCILVFRLISPGEAPPLPVFAREWGLIQGLLDILALFPALAFSALVLPFGIASDEKSYRGFSPHLFQRMTPPLVTAISAAGVYAMLFFLVLPLAQNYEANLRYRGEIYHLAKERAQAHRQAGEWAEADQFIGLCDSIWPNSPEIAALRSEVDIHKDEVEEHHWVNTEDTSVRGLNSASVSAIPGQGQPMNAAEAITMGEAALKDGRMFDAHWLATLGGRLAPAGSIERTKAAQLASDAWNQIESLQPTDAERQKHEIYRLKRSGYEAMLSGDWIRAYYIFMELLTKTPNDPDAENYFKACEKGTKEVAFFIDEMETSLGESLTRVVFSLPGGLNREKERSVLRVDSFSTQSDYAYGTGIEYMVFDAQSRLLLTLQADYAKFLPFTTTNGQQQVLVMLRALNRHDKNKHWEPQWTEQGTTTYSPNTAQIIWLNVSYETFLMLSEMRQRLPSLHIDALFAAAGIAGETGYIPEVFEAEILNRLGACLFFLPMAIIVLIVGWNLRAKNSPRYLFVLSIPLLPLIFHGLTYLYRTVLNTIGVSLIYTFGFSIALLVFIVILSVSFILSLIALAAQHD